MSSDCKDPTSAFATNEEGYLIEFTQWQPDFAKKIANQDNIALNDAHWEIISLLRKTYAETQVSPSTRALVKLIKHTFQDPNKGNSLYLMQLFPGKPALIACKLAGLPKPKLCF